MTWRYRQYRIRKLYQRLVRTACRLLYKDNGRDLRDSIIVAGVGRSGTTWVADLIASQARCRIMFEPFNSTAVLEFSHFHYFQYMRPDQENEALHSACRAICSGGIRNPWIDQQVECLFPECRVIKDVRANLFLRWLHGKFPEIPILFVIRHPCAVVHSQKTLGWATDSDIQSFLQQQDLVEDFLSDKMDVIRDAKTDEEKLAVLWCVGNTVPLAQFSSTRLNVVFYEYLCSEPATEIPLLFSAIRRDYGESVFRRLGRPSTLSRRESAILTGEDRVTSWRDKMSSRQIREVLSVVEAFGLDHLYGDSALPRIRGPLDQRIA